MAKKRRKKGKKVNKVTVTLDGNDIDGFLSFAEAQNLTPEEMISDMIRFIAAMWESAQMENTHYIS